MSLLKSFKCFSVDFLAQDFFCVLKKKFDLKGLTFKKNLVNDRQHQQTRLILRKTRYIV